MPTIFSSPTRLSLKQVQPKAIRIPSGIAGKLIKETITQTLQRHAAVLQSYGISDLATLGKLPISGTVIPQPGLLKPPTRVAVKINDIIERNTAFRGAFRIKPGSSGSSAPLERSGGPAYLLKAEPFPQSVSQPVSAMRGGSRPSVFYLDTVVPVTTAYWAADEIEIANDTSIILRQPNHWLVIIANKITFGTNVCFSWETVNKGMPEPPPKLPKPGELSKSIYMSGTDGGNGANGSQGANGYSGDDGPEVEIWTLDVNRLPSEVLLTGQDGFKGGKGQDGQDGQDGAKGRGYIPGSIPGTCSSGPGNGGRGGDGGAGGPGGRGGDGGHGGRFNLYAPSNIILNLTSQGYYVDTKEGQGGPGGDFGIGGQGGAGGRRGNDRDGVGCPTDFGKDGAAGNPGANGVVGSQGSKGDHYDNAEAFSPIDSNAFVDAFNKPSISGLTAQYAVSGDAVSVAGKNFTNRDTIFVDTIKASTTFIKNTELSFIVPTVNGGRQKAVYVTQQDGTTSNRATLHVLPKCLWVEQDGNKSIDSPTPRFTPGRKVTIVGTGFSNKLSIKVNDEYAADSDITYTDATKVSFTLFRPANVVPNPSGENVSIQVILDDGSASSPIQIILDTVVMVVLGDSIQWGQGLREDLKFHSMVEQFVSNSGVIGVYKKVLAHSGATIGVGDNNQAVPVHGEVPTSYPTILQQVDSYADNPALVDLVMIDGGINDIGVGEIVNPIETSDLANKCQTYCYNDMKFLLDKVTRKFPNSKVVVTGYYQIVSDDSDVSALILFLTALGLMFGGLAGAIVGGAVSATQKGVMVARSKTFADQANQKLQQAVTDVKTANSALGLNKDLFFAKPMFKDSNAIFASDSWLWGIEGDSGPSDDEQLGGVEQVRNAACELVDSQEPGRTSMTKCVRASIGHPNVKGAQEYGRVIKALL